MCALATRPHGRSARARLRDVGCDCCGTAAGGCPRVVLIVVLFSSSSPPHHSPPHHRGRTLLRIHSRSRAAAQASNPHPFGRPSPPLLPQQLPLPQCTPARPGGFYLLFVTTASAETLNGTILCVIVVSPLPVRPNKGGETKVTPNHTVKFSNSNSVRNFTTLPESLPLGPRTPLGPAARETIA